MSKLTTFREAVDLVEHDPENPKKRELLLAAVDLANEQSEVEFRVMKIGDEIVGLIEQMDKMTAAEAAQRIVEIKTGLGK